MEIPFALSAYVMEQKMDETPPSPKGQCRLTVSSTFQPQVLYLEW